MVWRIIWAMAQGPQHQAAVVSNAVEDVGRARKTGVQKTSLKYHPLTHAVAAAILAEALLLLLLLLSVGVLHRPLPVAGSL